MQAQQPSAMPPQSLPVAFQNPDRRNKHRTTSQDTDTYQTRSKPLNDLLQKIKNSSDILDHVELLYVGDRTIDKFDEDPQGRIQAFVICSDLKLGGGSASSLSSGVGLGPDPGAGAILAVTALSSPSDVLGMAGHMLRDRVLVGRPDDRFGYPNAIFDPHLAKLHYDLERLHTLDNDSEEVSAVAQKYRDVSLAFFHKALADYSDEKDRWDNCRQFFTRIFGNLVEEQWIPASTASKASVVTPDAFGGIVWSSDNSSPSRPLPHVILEVKREKGCGEPTMQCIKYYAATCSNWIKTKKVFTSTMFPVILIGLNGHSLEISTALTLERIVVNELLTFDMKNDLNHGTMVLKLTWIASALAECASGLKEKYQHIIQRASPTTPHQRFFPQPTPDPRSPPSELPRGLTFLKRLDQNNNSFEIPNDPSAHCMRSLFTGTLVLNQSKVRVVIKFTAKYNEEAHKLLAEKGLAPKLYACQRVIGNLFMVVMERLDGVPLAFGGWLQDTVFQDIARAVDILGQHDLVHGDLRTVNVMVDPKKEHAKVIDFDWAGKSGTARYPLTINKAALMHEWHSDVEGGGLMKTYHDEFALNSVLKNKCGHQ